MKRLNIKDLNKSHKNKNIFAVKLYPAGAQQIHLKELKRIKDIYNILKK